MHPLVRKENTEVLHMKQCRQALNDRLAGKSNEQISIRRGIPPGQVDDYVSFALEDLKSSELHNGVRATIIERLINDIQELERWEKQLAPIRIKKYQAVDGKGNKHDLEEDNDNDRLLKTKYSAEKRQLYNMLITMMKIETTEEDTSNRDKVNDTILKALVRVAEKKGALHEKINQQNTVDVTPIEVEEIKTLTDEEDNV